MDLFGDLSYNNKTREFIGRPVDDLRALYKSKHDDYNYVVDATNNLKTVLRNVKYNPKNRDRILEANSKLENVIGEFSKTGDFENKIIETKQLANDIANNYGLRAVSEDYQKEQAYKTQLQEAVKAGEISQERYKQYVMDASQNYKGVAKDEELGTYTSTFNGRSPVKQTDWSKELVDLANGWKADKVPLTDQEGRTIQADTDGKGYIMLNGTKEYVDEGEVAAALKTYLKTNPNFKSEVSEDLYFEYKNNFVDPETGEFRKPTIQDIKRATQYGVSSDVTKMFKSTTEEELLKSLEERGLDTGDLYNIIRTDQKMNDYIKTAVDKESYKKYELNYVKDWLSEDSGNSTDSLKQEFGMSSTWYTRPKLRSEDLARNATLAKDSGIKVKQLEEDILLNAPNMHPNVLQSKQNELMAAKIMANKAKERFTDFTNSDAIKPLIDNVLTPRQTAPSSYTGGMGSNNSTTAGKSLGDYSTLTPMKLQDLMLKQLNGELANEDLTLYIKDGVNKEQGANKLKSDLMAINRVLTTKIDNNEVAYNKDFKEISLPELKAEDRRSNPTHQFVTQLDNLVKSGSTYYRMLGDIHSDLPIVDMIEEQEDVKNENGDILWNKATLIPSYNNELQADGSKYNNVFRLSVPVLQDGKEVIKTYAVRSADEGVNTKFREVITDQRNALINKSKVTPLKDSEKQILDDLNLNLYQSSKYGSELDIIDWYSKDNKEVTKIDFWEKDGKPLSAYVKTFNYNAPADMSHYLVDKEGNYYTKNVNTGLTKKLTEAELYLPENKDFKAIGGNTVKDLKHVLANQISNSVNFGITPPSENLFNVSTIYGSDVKDENTLPFLDQKYYESNVSLKSDFPALYITDAFRPINSTVGVEDSNHKQGKALDFRYNSDAISLTRLPKDQLAKYNIKSAEVHGQGTDNIHIHVEFN